ncbi:hypothetical protein [Acinetobacter sp. A47]|nr:hypothetical protein [Acinetobacter sp. A47]
MRFDFHYTERVGGYFRTRYETIESDTLYGAQVKFVRKFGRVPSHVSY